MQFLLQSCTSESAKLLLASVLWYLHNGPNSFLALPLWGAHDAPAHPLVSWDGEYSPRLDAFDASLSEPDTLQYEVP